LENIYLIFAVAMAFGMSFSGVMASFLVCTRMMVSLQFLARSMAVVGMLGWIGMGIGGFQGGYAFDLTGNYFWSFGIGSLAGVVNLAILFMFSRHIRRNLRWRQTAAA